MDPTVIKNCTVIKGHKDHSYEMVFVCIKYQKETKNLKGNK